MCAPTGHLLFARDRTVFAAPFDVETLEILGQPVPVLDDVATADAVDTNAVSQFAVAPGGHAAAIRLSHPEAGSTYRWVRLASDGTDAGAGSRAARAPRNAEPAAVPFPAREIRWLALSPDGARLAIARGDGHRSEIWMSDANGGGLQRLTTDGQNLAPLWTADSRRVIYASRQDGPFALFARTVGDAAAAAGALRASPPALATAAAAGASNASAGVIVIAATGRGPASAIRRLGDSRWPRLCRREHRWSAATNGTRPVVSAVDRRRTAAARAHAGGRNVRGDLAGWPLARVSVERVRRLDSDGRGAR